MAEIADKWIDLDSRENIRDFVQEFYARLLADELLAPIFLEIAGVNLDDHLPRIVSYWEKLLLGTRDYRRHTMNIHRDVAAKRPLGRLEFNRWLSHFEATIDAGFRGPKSERARSVANRIAGNMQIALVDSSGFDENLG